MPEPARGQGVKALMKELDRRIAAEGNNTVDEMIFFQALEGTAPSHLAPVMMESIKHYTRGYKEGATYEQSPNELYQEVMREKSLQGDILKGGNYYDGKRY
jgi:GTPase Era involved in 16S rRNA processing